MTRQHCGYSLQIFQRMVRMYGIWLWGELATNVGSDLVDNVYIYIKNIRGALFDALSIKCYYVHSILDISVNEYDMYDWERLHLNMLLITWARILCITRNSSHSFIGPRSCAVVCSYPFFLHIGPNQLHQVHPLLIMADIAFVHLVFY